MDVTMMRGCGYEQDQCARAGHALSQDQIVPCAGSAPLSRRPLKAYSGFPHGLPSTEAKTIKAEKLSS